MADILSLNQEGFLRSSTETPPNHFAFKIQLFSLLEKNNIEKYTSTDFEAGGYKWRLVLHPKGNKSKGISDHISLYLAIVESNSFPSGWEVRAAFRLFLLDQYKDTYLTLQDATAENGRRFHGMKLEWGLDKFISHTDFNDSANGYLVNDTCVFGAEVYVTRERHTGKGECLSMVKDPISYKNIWRIEGFSALSEEYVESKPFMVADHKWKMRLYPQGTGSGTGNYISLYLVLAEPGNLSPTSKMYVEFTLRILDQIHASHYFGKATYWFSASTFRSGWPRFVSHAYFNLSNVGLLVKNTCILEAELSIHGFTNAI